MIDTYTGLAGNFGIRATVTVGSGSGGGGTPTLQFSSSLIDSSGTLALGQAASAPVTVKNPGTSSVTVSGIKSSLATFSASPQSFTLAAGASTTVTVTHTAPASGAAAEQATLTFNLGGGATSTLRVTSAATVTSGCTATAPGLLSWWAGDGNATDLTGGNNAAPQGNVSYTTGKVGQAFALASNGYLSVGNPTNLRLTSAMTINAWINPTVALSSGNLTAIVTKWAQVFNVQADTDGFGFWMQQNGSALNLFAAVHLAGGTSEPHAIGGNVPLNTWSHVAMTFDGANIVAYVNGQAVATSPAAGSIISSTRNILIGREDSTQPRPFTGGMDEIQIHGRALSAAEIQAIYNAGSNGVCKPGR